MAIPTKKQMLHWAEQYVALWNAGDKAGWVENWRRIAPGNARPDAEYKFLSRDSQTGACTAIIPASTKPE